MFLHFNRTFEDGINGELAAVLHGQKAITAQIDQLEKLMSPIASQLSAVQANLTDVQNDVATLASGVTGLNTQIAALQAQIASGAGDSLTPATQTLLTNLVSQGTALQTTADAAAAELPGTATATATSSTPAATPAIKKTANLP